MRKHLFATIALCQALVLGTVMARSACADAAADALKKLEGTYTVVSAVKSGDKLPEEEAKKMKVVIAGDKLTISMGEGQSETAGIKVDPSKTPAWIDIIPPGNPGKDEPVAGIYKLEGDTLTICFNKGESKEHPKDFSGEHTSVLTLKLQK